MAVHAKAHALPHQDASRCAAHGHGGHSAQRRGPIVLARQLGGTVLRFNGDVRSRHRKAHVGVVQHHAGVTRQRVLDTLREADAPHVKGHALRHFRLVHVHRQFGALRGLYLSLVVDLAALDGNGVGLGLVVGVRGGIRVNGVRGILLIVCLQRHCTVRHFKSQRVCFQLFFAQTQSALFHRPLGEVITGLCLGCHFDFCIGFVITAGFGFIVANVAIFNGQGVGRRCIVLVGCRCSGRMAGHFNLNGCIGQLIARYRFQATAQLPSGKLLVFRYFLRQGDFCIFCILSAVLCPILISDDAIHNRQAVRLLPAVCGQLQLTARHRQGIGSILVFRNRVHVKLVRVTCPAVQFKLLVGKLWLDLNRCVFCELGSCHINKLRIHQRQRILRLFNGQIKRVSTTDILRPLCAIRGGDRHLSRKRTVGSIFRKLNRRKLSRRICDHIELVDRHLERVILQARICGFTIRIIQFYRPMPLGQPLVRRKQTARKRSRAARFFHEDGIADFSVIANRHAGIFKIAVCDRALVLHSGIIAHNPNIRKLRAAPNNNGAVDSRVGIRSKFKRTAQRQGAVDVRPAVALISDNFAVLINWLTVGCNGFAIHNYQRSLVCFVRCRQGHIARGHLEGKGLARQVNFLVIRTLERHAVADCPARKILAAFRGGSCYGRNGVFCEGSRGLLRFLTDLDRAVRHGQRILYRIVQDHITRGGCCKGIIVVRFLRDRIALVTVDIGDCCYRSACVEDAHTKLRCIGKVKHCACYRILPGLFQPRCDRVRTISGRQTAYTRKYTIFFAEQAGHIVFSVRQLIHIDRRVADGTDIIQSTSLEIALLCIAAIHNNSFKDRVCNGRITQRRLVALNHHGIASIYSSAIQIEFCTFQDRQDFFTAQRPTIALIAALAVGFTVSRYNIAFPIERQGLIIILIAGLQMHFICGHFEHQFTIVQAVLTCDAAFWQGRAIFQRPARKILAAFRVAGRYGHNGVFFKAAVLCTFINRTGRAGDRAAVYGQHIYILGLVQHYRCVVFNLARIQRKGVVPRCTIPLPHCNLGAIVNGNRPIIIKILISTSISFQHPDLRFIGITGHHIHRSAFYLLIIRSFKNDVCVRLTGFHFQRVTV